MPAPFTIPPCWTTSSVSGLGYLAGRMGQTDAIAIVASLLP